MPGRRGRPKPPLKGTPLPTPLEQRWTLTQIGVAHQLTNAGLVAMILRGEIAAEKIGKEWRVTDSQYRDWLRRCQYRPTPGQQSQKEAA